MTIRGTTALLLFMALAFAGRAQAADVQLELSLKDGKTSFRSGEPVLLQLTFRAGGPGFAVNVTTTTPPSPIDDIILSPTDGATPWMEQQARGHRYSPDYFSTTNLEPGKPVTVSLTLNDLYRFDRPGHFTVHVVSRRVGTATTYGMLQGTGALTSNEVSFDMEPYAEADEAVLANALEGQIRAATDRIAADRLAKQLEYLPGDAATRVKLSLYLKPKVFYPFGVDVSSGLWIARNRAMVITGLEKALADPAQEISSSTVEMLAALKLSLDQPYRPGQTALPPDAINEIKRACVHRLAATLPARTGDSLVSAAETVVVLSRGRPSSADLQAAREVLITHFGEVNEYHVDWLLNAYGDQLRDPRMIPALEHILDSTSDPMFSSSRTAALSRLAELAPSEIPRYLAQEACAAHPVLLQQVKNLSSADTLPGVDDCLRRKLQQQIAGEGRRFDLGVTMSYIARFADGALVEPVRAAYLGRTAEWDQTAEAGAVVYLMRWDPAHSRALLDPLLPGNDRYGGAMVSFIANLAHTPADGLRAVFREKLRSAPPEQAGSYAYLLAQIGAPEDREFLREQLERVRARAAAQPDLAAGPLETELVSAVEHGASWQASKEEQQALERGCISNTCKERFNVK